MYKDLVQRYDAPPRQARHHRLGAVNGFRGQTDTLRKMSDRVEHDLLHPALDLPHGPADHRPHGDLRMDGPQCLWDEPRSAARFPRGMPADRQPIRGIPMAGSGGVRGLCWRPPVVVVRPG